MTLRHDSPAATSGGRRVLRTALAAICAAGALCVPAHADIPADAYPSPQAIAANAEFLLQAPPPPNPAAVCVIDTGVTPLPDLGDQIVERRSVVGDDLDDAEHVPGDPTSGHGSFVAGTIASQVDGRGTAGIWPHAKIVSVRVVSGRGVSATAADYVKALYQCRVSLHPVSVVNLSLGGPVATNEELNELRNRIAKTRDSGINVVAGAGNDGGNVNYPAAFPEAFAVAATTGDGAFCSFSSRGPEIDLGALGCNLDVTASDGSSRRVAGTSFSAPTVSGVLAALRAYRPDLSVIDGERLLISTATNTSGGLVLNARAAFRVAGLGHLVDAQAASPPSTPPLVDTAADPCCLAATPRAVVQTLPVFQSRLRKPKIASVSFNDRRLSVIVRGRPRSARVVFQIDSKTYNRASSRLKIRVRSWKQIRVCFENVWGERSAVSVQRRRR